MQTTHNADGSWSHTLRPRFSWHARSLGRELVGVYGHWQKTLSPLAIAIAQRDYWVTVADTGYTPGFCLGPNHGREYPAVGKATDILFRDTSECLRTLSGREAVRENRAVNEAAIDRASQRVAVAFRPAWIMLKLFKAWKRFQRSAEGARIDKDLASLRAQYDANAASLEALSALGDDAALDWLIADTAARTAKRQRRGGQ